ncbi:hypothetical protein [Kitasatospora sp. NPDC093679]|uniref:hypothetical protein n=1 Tax=Kitasatospora sp. NPDC093679 TaxID=3154983 RepID=UPI00341EC2B7
MLVQLIVGVALLPAGLSGLARVRSMTPVGYRGRGSWNRWQRIISLISPGLALAGLAVLG